MYDLQTINASQLATVTDRLLLQRGAARRRPGFLRVPPSLDLNVDLACAPPRVAPARPRRIGLGGAVLAALFMVVVVLSGVVANQHVSRAGFGDAAPAGLRP